MAVHCDAVVPVVEPTSKRFFHFTALLSIRNENIDFSSPNFIATDSERLSLTEGKAHEWDIPDFLPCNYHILLKIITPSQNLSENVILLAPGMSYLDHKYNPPTNSGAALVRVNFPATRKLPNIQKPPRLSQGAEDAPGSQCLGQTIARQCVR